MDSFIIIIVGIIFIVFLIKVTRPQKIKNYPSNGKKIIAFGDSLIAGYGASTGNDFVSLLEDEIGESIVNLGVPGEITLHGLSRVDIVTKQHPKVVMVLLGGNDYIRGIPIETTFKTLDEIVQKIQKAGAVVIILGIQGGILTDPYEKRFRALARKREALYVPNVLEGIIGNADYMSDEVHPNDKGYRIIADKIYPTLVRAL